MKKQFEISKNNMSTLNIYNVKMSSTSTGNTHVYLSGYMHLVIRLDNEGSRLRTKNPFKNGTAMICVSFDCLICLLFVHVILDFS